MVHEVEDQLTSKNMAENQKIKQHSFRHITVTTLVTVMLVLAFSCSNKKTGNAPDIKEQDSLPTMQALGVYNLISDSGVIRYKLIAEEWNIYNTSNPPKWTFVKGLLMEKFDTTFHTEWFVQADTAYCYKQELWELRGRVTVKNVQGTLFKTEELFWDMKEHEIYSSQYVKIITPTREIEGVGFKSNEQMTQYIFYNTKGYVPFEDSNQKTDSTTNIKK